MVLAPIGTSGRAVVQQASASCCKGTPLQKALRYNLKTIMTYLKTPNTTFFIRSLKHPYKNSCNLAARLPLHYKILKAVVMRLSK